MLRNGVDLGIMKVYTFFYFDVHQVYTFRTKKIHQRGIVSEGLSEYKYLYKEVKPCSKFRIDLYSRKGEMILVYLMVGYESVIAIFYLESLSLWKFS